MFEYKKILNSLLTPRKERRSLLASAALAFACLFFAALVLFPPISQKQDAPNRRHGMNSLEHAITGAFCGNPLLTLKESVERTETVKYWSGGEITDSYFALYLQNHPDQRRLPLKQVIKEYAGSDIITLCPTLKEGLQLHDPGLSIMMYGLLKLFPDISFNQIGHTLYAFRVALIFAGVFFMAHHGLAVVHILLAAWAFLAADKAFQSVYYTSLYPYITAYIFFFTALFMHITQNGAWGKIKTALPYGLLTAILLAAAWQTRISLKPIITVLFAISLFLSWKDLARFPPFHFFKTPKVLNALISGCLIFGFVFIISNKVVEIVVTPFTKKITSIEERRLDYHTIAHPVIIGLAATRKPSDLVKRENIEKIDTSGFDLVARLSPKADRLTYMAEGILWKYYRDLWHQFPIEMISIYLTKSGESFLHIIKNSFNILKDPQVNRNEREIYLSYAGFFPWPIALIVCGLILHAVRRIYLNVHTASGIYYGLTLLAASLIYVEMIATYALTTAHMYASLAFIILLFGLAPHMVTKADLFRIRELTRRKAKQL